MKNTATELPETRDRAKRGSDTFILTLGTNKVLPAPSPIVEGEKLNQRSGFGDIAEFAESIYAYGRIESPLQGYKKKDTYFISDGERRFLAVQYINQKYGVDFPFPFTPDARGTTDADRLFKQIALNNSGKKFSVVEEYKVVETLLELGISDEEIKRKLNITNVYYSGLKLLKGAPKKLTDMIVNGQVSGTLAISLIREYKKDYAFVIEVLENTIIESKLTDVTKKTITKKDVDKSTGVVNSWSVVKKIFKKEADYTVRQEKVEIFNMLRDIINGKVTAEKLIKELFEPIGE